MDFFVIWIVFMIFMTIVSIRSAQKKNTGVRPRRRTVSSDGHEVPPGEDLTVDTGASHYSRYKEKADEEFGRRYIVHNEPTQGYVILNGVMRSLDECKDL